MIYLIKLLLIFINIIIIILTIAFLILIERKIMGSIQRRRGPTQIGFFGILQPFADGLKLILKEINIPTHANWVLMLFSPIFTFFITIFIWAFISYNTITNILHIPITILFLIGYSSLSVYGIIFAGWSSNSKYSFLGSIRSASQLISYELCISIIYANIGLLSEQFTFSNIIYMQSICYFLIPLYPLFILFIIASLAELNRAPFDLPEAEAELVAGYNVEYSSLPFALFFLAEYGNLFIVSNIIVLLFLGGTINSYNIFNYSISYIIKICIIISLFIIIRASFPRYRYDQLMKLGWKILLPLICTLILFFCSIYINI